MDKLKRFGFAIHGCIDGYSNIVSKKYQYYVYFYCIDILVKDTRKVLWLRVAKSNNDPRIIAYYYLECVKQLQGLCILLCRLVIDITLSIII